MVDTSKFWLIKVDLILGDMDEDVGDRYQHKGVHVVHQSDGAL